MLPGNAARPVAVVDRFAVSGSRLGTLTNRVAPARHLIIVFVTNNHQYFNYSWFTNVEGDPGINERVKNAHKSLRLVAPPRPGILEEKVRNSSSAADDDDGQVLWKVIAQNLSALQIPPT